MTPAEVWIELEKQVGPLDESARRAVEVALHLVDQEQILEEPVRGVPPAAFQGENPSFEEASQLSVDQRSRLMQALQERNRAWLEQKCRELEAKWLFVVDGQVLLHGANLGNYPGDEQIVRLCRETGKLPLVFVRLYPIEEKATWPSTIYPGDFYPTIPLRLSSQGGSAHLFGDFDTGTSEIYADWELLDRQGVVQITSADQFAIDVHLGQSFSYVVKNLTATLTAADGSQRDAVCGVICVRNWTNGPFVAINATRTALVGREVGLQLQPTVSLDFAQRLTTLQW
jgi:hypothetical protein